MHDHLYKKLNIHLDLHQFDQIKMLDTIEFKTSPYDAKYILPSQEVREYVGSKIPLPPAENKQIIWQILKNPANTTYAMHVDAIRYSAINTLVSLPNPDHEFVMESDTTGKITLDYNSTPGIPYLINVEQRHGVWNRSSTHNRYILTIGFFTKNYNYDFMLDWLAKCRLI